MSKIYDKYTKVYLPNLSNPGAWRHRCIECGKKAEELFNGYCRKHSKKCCKK